MNNQPQINISDIINKLKQIKFPIIRILSNKIIKKYKIQKNYKPNNIRVSLPPILKNVNMQIDESDIISKQFGNYVLNFVNKLSKNMSIENLMLLYNNLEDLRLGYKNYFLHNWLFKYKLAGTYHVKKNKVGINKGSLEHAIYHELFHMASSYYEKDGDKRFSGFSQKLKANKTTIGKGLNEGYTQALTERYFGENNEVYGSYKLVTHFARNLERIIGKSKMESLYFRADLFGLIEELKQYDNEDNIIKLLSDFDCILGKKTKSIEDNQLNTSLINIQKTLLIYYIKKLNKELSNNLITSIEFKQRLDIYIFCMLDSITYRDKKYMLLDSYSIDSIKNEYVKENVITNKSL